MPSFDDALRVAIDRMRPAIEEQVSRDNSFLFYYKKQDWGGLVKYFENTRDGASKWWKVFTPYPVKQGVWGVRVEFGRIGVFGQTRVHAESSENLAWQYYTEKLLEKQSKGYKLKQATSESAELKQIQTAAKRKLKREQSKPPCDHATLTIAGKNKWKCGSCSTVIEFGKSLINETPEVSEAVRYINLGGIDD